jgi:putative transposase
VLKYLDESGCCLWSPVSYSYSRVGEQKRLEQTRQRWGRRISILGIWQPDQQFDYALAQGGFKTSSYLKVMAAQAQKAAQMLAETGQITVIVQDNGPVHTSHAAQAEWQNWQQQGLFLFMLPKYCSEMNDIETEWHQLKTHEIAGQMFDNEYDLAMAVIDGMTARSQKNGYTLERFKFNPA